MAEEKDEMRQHSKKKNLFAAAKKISTGKGRQGRGRHANTDVSDLL